MKAVVGKGGTQIVPLSDGDLAQKGIDAQRSIRPWRVRLSVVYGRLQPANRASLRTILENDPAKVEAIRELGGVVSDDASIRTWLTNNGEDPDVILARGG